MGRLAFVHRGRPEDHVVLRSMIQSVGPSEVDCFDFSSMKTAVKMPLIFCLKKYSRIVLSDPLVLWICPYLFAFRNVVFISFEMFECQVSNQRLINFFRNCLFLLSHYCALLLSSSVIFSNRLRQSYYVKRLKRLSSKSKIFPNLFKSRSDAKKIDDLSPQIKEIVASGKIIFLYAGTISDDRCAEAIFRTFAYNHIKRDMVLIVAGTVAKCIVEQYNCDSICFVGKLSYSEMLGLYEYVDYGFAAYSNDLLNTKFCAPVKIYEYWHFGIEVIANDNFSLKTYRPWIRYFFHDCKELLQIVNLLPKNVSKIYRRFNFDQEFYNVLNA